MANDRRFRYEGIFISIYMVIWLNKPSCARSAQREVDFVFTVGEERDVISWFVDKNLVLSSYRNLAAGSAVRLFDKPVSEPTKTNLPTDMITFRY